MKPSHLALCVVLALAACSQRDICLNDATRELRTITKLVETTRANVARGYAIGTRDVVREVRRRCVVTQPDGREIVQICTRLRPQTKRFPVAIDLNAEQRKLESLIERQQQVARRTAGARQQCIAAYPEG